MCGICGYISKQKISLETLKEMNDSMLHRGPDDSGEIQMEASDGYTIGMGHRRLSIMDLSPLGHQPMANMDRQIYVVYNGEIYNFKELKMELQAKGYAFFSSCDTEVVVAAYQEWGTDFLGHFNGMFAIALWDAREETLILARDRMGKKPLYYFLDGTGTLVWASELKPIMKYPYFKKAIRADLISSYLCRKYIKAPDTIFEDTYKLEPGQCAIWHWGGVKKFYYWNAIDRYQQLKNSYNEDFQTSKSELKELLFDSVQRRLIADVPVGVFLSGGIDSSLIASVAKEITDERIKTFTIGFNEKEENEAEHAKQLASYLGTKHTELYLSNNDLLDMLEDLPTYYDEPFADPSQIPTMLVSKLARQDVAVVLSGDGGDELFCGYNAYENLRIAKKMDKIGGLLYPFKNSNVFGKSSLWNKVPYGVDAVIENRNRNGKVQLFVNMAEQQSKAMVKGKSISAIYDEKVEIENWQIRRMLLDMQSYLPDEVLAKVDRASMKYSLEARCPLLDYRIVEFSFQIPHEYKYYKKNKKRILKSILYDFAPQELLDRPKKGFSVPLSVWFRTCLKDRLYMYADKDIIEKQGIFNYMEVKRNIDSIQVKNNEVICALVWAFLIFQMWYQTYIEDLWKKQG